MKAQAYDGYDEQRNELYYYCPFCRCRVYDNSGCNHTVYLYDLTNMEPFDYCDDFDVICRAASFFIYGNPSRFLSDFAEYYNSVDNALGETIDNDSINTDNEDGSDEEDRNKFSDASIDDINEVVERIMTIDELEDIVLSTGLGKLIPSLQTVEKVDSDNRSYNAGGFGYALINNRDRKRLKKYVGLSEKNMAD